MIAEVIGGFRTGGQTAHLIKIPCHGCALAIDWRWSALQSHRRFSFRFRFTYQAITARHAFSPPPPHQVSRVCGPVALLKMDPQAQIGVVTVVCVRFLSFAPLVPRLNRPLQLCGHGEFSCLERVDKASRLTPSQLDFTAACCLWVFDWFLTLEDEVRAPCRFGRSASF